MKENIITTTIIDAMRDNYIKSLMTQCISCAEMVNRIESVIAEEKTLNRNDYILSLITNCLEQEICSLKEQISDNKYDLIQISKGIDIVGEVEIMPTANEAELIEIFCIGSYKIFCMESVEEAVEYIKSLSEK